MIDRQRYPKKRRMPKGSCRAVMLRMDKDEYERIKDIAAIETNVTGRSTSAQDLMRLAIKFVYEDGERLRECFRRSRHRASQRVR